MNRNPAARRYARALFSLGKKAGVERLGELGRDLTALVDALHAQPQLLRVFRSPLFSAEEKRGVVGRILSELSASPLMRDFCALLADKKRLALLPDIQSYFGAMSDEEQGIVRGEVVTAVALSADRQSALLAQLEKNAGKKLSLVFSVNSAILGGLMLKVGDRVLDASLAAQLNAMKERIAAGMA